MAYSDISADTYLAAPSCGSSRSYIAMQPFNGPFSCSKLSSPARSISSKNNSKTPNRPSTRHSNARNRKTFDMNDSNTLPNPNQRFQSHFRPLQKSTQEISGKVRDDVRLPLDSLKSVRKHCLTKNRNKSTTKEEIMGLNVNRARNYPYPKQGKCCSSSVFSRGSSRIKLDSSNVDHLSWGNEYLSIKNNAESTLEKSFSVSFDKEMEDENIDRCASPSLSEKSSENATNRQGGDSFPEGCTHIEMLPSCVVPTSYDYDPPPLFEEMVIPKVICTVAALCLSLLLLWLMGRTFRYLDINYVRSSFLSKEDKDLTASVDMRNILTISSEF